MVERVGGAPPPAPAFGGGGNEVAVANKLKGNIEDFMEALKGNSAMAAKNDAFVAAFCESVKNINTASLEATKL